MKAKPIFYLNGNNRRFEDQHTISVMTGEPMPRKWQEFFELTPEEKARWDASLKLDEEYRIAEAQGFPNGIPGGKTRGDMLHYLTQQEEAHKKVCKKEASSVNLSYRIRRKYKDIIILYRMIHLYMGRVMNNRRSRLIKN